MVAKVDNLLTKTIQAPSIKVVQAMVSFCPSVLQTDKMIGAKDVKKAIPLVNEEEWEKYVTYPAQRPPPETTATGFLD